jgi:hypothetical protein
MHSRVARPWSPTPPPHVPLTEDNGVPTSAEIELRAALAEFPEHRTPEQQRMVDEYHLKTNGEWESLTAQPARPESDSSTPANVPPEDSDFQVLTEQIEAVESVEVNQ